MEFIAFTIIICLQGIILWGLCNKGIPTQLTADKPKEVPFVNETLHLCDKDGKKRYQMDTHGKELAKEVSYGGKTFVRKGLVNNVHIYQEK